MKDVFKINISKFEKNILMFCLIITIIWFVIIIINPISADAFQNVTYLFEMILIFLFVYIISRTAVITFVKLSLVIWGKSWIWEYRKKFVLFILNSAMYIFTLTFLVSIVQGFIQLDIWLIMSSLGFLGVLSGRYNIKKRYTDVLSNN